MGDETDGSGDQRRQLGPTDVASMAIHRGHLI
jgi:hypothetical protein